jgi:hypothetical protein
VEFHEKVLDETSKIEWRDRIQLRPGVNRFGENVLKTDILVFEPGADLHLGEFSGSYCAIIAKVIHIQDGTVPSAIQVDRRNGTNGPSGPDGPDGARSGAHGRNGEDGEDATEATTPPPFLIFCDELSYGKEPQPGQSAVLIDASGGNGADGGDGGDGGNGRNGGKGWPGISVNGTICP